MRKFKNSLITSLTWLIVIIFFFPVFWMFINAFKSEQDASAIPPTLIFEPNFSGFQRLMDRGMADYLLNSLTSSVLSTLIVLLLAIPAAYALSIRPIKKIQDVLFFFISTRFLPAAASLLPLYMIFKSLGVLDNINALSLVYAAMNLPIAVWMMRSFFNEVPMEIVEAAQIDGANFRTELIRIVLPIVLPGIAAVALICFIFSWNEYFLATLLTTSDAKTAPPFLASFVDGRGLFLGVLSAASMVAALPVLIAGWIAQKQLVRGLAMGAVK
jgi:sorbitol/mannitol transport system permease protein